MKLPTQIETVKIYMEKLYKKREKLASIAESLLLESRVILAHKQRDSRLEKIRLKRLGETK